MAITATCRVLRVAVKQQRSLGNREREENGERVYSPCLTRPSLQPIASPKKAIFFIFIYFTILM
jgi:hypothetical protein